MRNIIRRLRNVGSQPAEETVGADDQRPVRSFQLPDSLATIRVNPRSGAAYDVVCSAEPSAYERELLVGQDWGSGDLVWLLRHLLKAGGTLIDVGANIGLISVPIALDGTPVIAFEMLPQNCLKLRLASVVNNVRQIHVVQMAISSTDGLLTYGGDHAWGTVGTGVHIACALKLDTALRMPDLKTQSDSGPLVVKIDVEGHEFDVLKGASTLLAERRPVIIFESIKFANHDPDQNSSQCKRLLETLNYRLFLQRGQRLIPRGSGELQEGLVVDCLAIPAEAAALLDGLDVRRLDAAERASWVDEMAVQVEPSHRSHAVAAIRALRLEDACFIPLTAISLTRLAEDDDAGIRASARSATFS